MATDKNYPIDLPILVIHAQIFVAVKKFPFLPNKQIPTADGILHETNVTLMDNNQCSETYEDLISVGKVCGQSNRPNKGACLVRVLSS